MQYTLPRMKPFISTKLIPDVENQTHMGGTFDFNIKKCIKHMPISKVILVLCKSCHTSYDTNRNNLTALDRVVNSNIKTNGELKVGKFVKNKMEELINNDLLSDKEIINLQSKDYSHDKLHIQYPLLRKVLPNDPDKIDRY